MLLTISTVHEPATDLGYLLHKHPDRLQTFDLSFGKAHVYYPEAGQDRCAACLLLDVDPVGMARGKNRNQNFLLGHYVNDTLDEQFPEWGETLPVGQFRHADHRFEWTRQEFQDWANQVAGRFGYSVRFLPVGPEDDGVGSPTQMGVFERG